MTEPARLPKDLHLLDPEKRRAFLYDPEKLGAFLAALTDAHLEELLDALDEEIERRARG